MKATLVYTTLLKATSFSAYVNSTLFTNVSIYTGCIVTGNKLLYWMHPLSLYLPLSSIDSLLLSKLSTP